MEVLDLAKSNFFASILIRFASPNVFANVGRARNIAPVSVSLGEYIQLFLLLSQVQVPPRRGLRSVASISPIDCLEEME